MIEFEKPLPENFNVDDLVERSRAIALERAAMRKLKEHPGWPAFIAIIKGNLKVLRQSTRSVVIQSMDHALVLNHWGGKAEALQEMLHLIESVDQAYELELMKLNAQIEEIRYGGRNSVSSAGGPGFTSDSTGEPEPEQLELPTADQLAP